MISDKERREVASRLKREAQVWRETFPGEEVDVCDAMSLMKDMCSFIGVGGALMPSVLFQRLADLIDRPTCKNESGYKNIFLCSECGARLEVAAEEGNEYGDIFNTPLQPRFCSVCGAEVVE